MREPFFSPVGAGLAPEETAGIQSANALAAPQPPSTGPPPSLNDFQQPPWGQQIYDAARPF